MIEENDVIEFLRDHNGQASLNEVSEGLSVPKYGPSSAYSLLQSLRSKGIVERKGEKWVLTAAEVAVPSRNSTQSVGFQICPKKQWKLFET